MPDRADKKTEAELFSCLWCILTQYGIYRKSNNVCECDVVMWKNKAMNTQKWLSRQYPY